MTSQRIIGRITKELSADPNVRVAALSVSNTFRPGEETTELDIDRRTGVLRMFAELGAALAGQKGGLAGFEPVRGQHLDAQYARELLMRAAIARR